MSLRKRTGKVGVVGTGMVGTSFAYALMQRSLASELVLIDIDHARAEGEAMDLNHGLPFVRPMRIYAGTYDDLAGADLIVIAAGANQRPGETRLDLLNRNVAIFREIIPPILAANDDGIIVVATNPVDILTTIGAQIAGPAANRVIGSGTILDTARFRYLLGQHYGVDPRSVHAYIVGEHGDSELALWSLANIAGVRLVDFVGANGQGYNQAALDAILEQTRNAAYEIIKRKRATYYAIGLGLLSIAEAVLRDQHTVMTISSLMNGQYGVSGIAISLPTIVGRDGAEEVLNLPLSEQEIALFQRSAGILKEHLSHVQ
ncbi:MAG TPA: L-lactate dehydrogenase [Chloroflexus aurantiacus]|jgi:L-lactate dehydrogenase|uniref:L-lactate dehydrogenase n=1 Tax=Chloroflexus aurantiacus (strain ATCC 29366 / DSM 635 / J-10-fl) TaxID=324602 RepID=A9WBT6_CHLAA|nr:MULTISPECIES: L-lactate dehydrogenase [Chloroflexus]ABY34893.1 L-lactate dehydrogenase [Chloroflexus aurantiacus J-10-fl]RMG46907.1 MAG: L-lactate dehydrogenase [Chloroflexota bacterium]GIV92760.1 MAG: L-lactate dehydrogenase [Chloroflexus sp.]HBW69027.1 L-lactate dehydrogenase [Chloroflexus aurantiacus]